jgi:hypothetical protein
VPHLLIHDLRRKQKEYATAILSFLHTTERDNWHYLVTGDQSWFVLNTSLRRMWTLSRDDVITKPRFDIQNKRIHVCNHVESERLYVVDRLPNDTKMNSDYFVRKILILLEQVIFPRGRVSHQK